jgi:hypothetical protein
MVIAGREAEMPKDFKPLLPDEVGRGLFARIVKTLERHLGNGSGDSARFRKKPALSGSQMDPQPADALVRPSTHHKVTIQIHHDDWP